MFGSLVACSHKCMLTELPAGGIFMRATRLLAAVVPLCFCMIQCAGAQVQQLVLRGTVVTPTEVIADGAVSISGSRIAQVEPFVARSQTAVETDSYIFPGLIDLHDHITWNFLPR